MFHLNKEVTPPSRRQALQRWGGLESPTHSGGRFILGAADGKQYTFTYRAKLWRKKPLVAFAFGSIRKRTHEYISRQVGGLTLLYYNVLACREVVKVL